MLRTDVEVRSTVETRANILEEMRLIRTHLESDEGESLRFKVSRPLTRVYDRPIASVSGLGNDLGISNVPSSLGGSPIIAEIDPTHTVLRESALTRSITKDTTTFSLRAVRKFSSSYHSAGLFDDCRHAFFNNDREVSVYELGDLRKKAASSTFSMVFTQEYKRGEFVQHVASSRGYIIIVTNERLLVFQIFTGTLVHVVSHGDWGPSGVACHESDTYLVVLLGQCQRSLTNRYRGQIKVYRYRLDGRHSRLAAFGLSLPLDDCPKRLFFDMNSQILTCITRIQNRVVAWKLDDDFVSSTEPFEFLKNNYTAVNAPRQTVVVD